MIAIRRSESRAHFNHGWLETRHGFSFGDYYDPANLGFRALRVINEDVVQPGKGFPTHPHREMEIITYIVRGALEHRDSMGNGSIIRAGEVQRMTAGTGVTHSEYNASDVEPVHLLQIWILPARHRLEPSYEQVTLPAEPAVQLVAAPEGGKGAVTVHQDVRLYRASLGAGRTAELHLAPDRHGWVQLISGRMQLNGEELHAGDSAVLSGETAMRMQAGQACEALVFDLA